MMQPPALPREPASGCTFVRIPGTLCDHRLWQRLNWPQSWKTLDVSLDNCRDFEHAAVDILAASQGAMVLVGFSMGGMIALEMARQAPERIVGLVLISTNHLTDDASKRTARSRNLTRLEAVGLATMVREDLIPRYFSGSPDSGICETVVEMAQAAGPKALQRQYEALALRRDQTATLQKFKSPILVIAGEHDLMCDPQQQQAIACQATEADIQILPGAGHFVPLEAPQALMRTIAQWADVRIEGKSCQTAF